MLPVIPTTRIMRGRQLTQSCIISAVLRILLTVLYKKNVNNVGALVVRTGFGGISYYTYNKEPPKPYPIYYGKRSQPFRRILGFTMVRCRQVLGTERGSPQNKIGVVIISGKQRNPLSSRPQSMAQPIAYPASKTTAEAGKRLSAQLRDKATATLHTSGLLLDVAQGTP